MGEDLPAVDMLVQFQKRETCRVSHSRFHIKNTSS